MRTDTDTQSLFCAEAADVSTKHAHMLSHVQTHVRADAWTRCLPHTMTARNRNRQRTPSRKSRGTSRWSTKSRTTPAFCGYFVSAACEGALSLLYTIHLHTNLSCWQTTLSMLSSAADGIPPCARFQQQPPQLTARALISSTRCSSCGITHLQLMSQPVIVPLASSYPDAMNMCICSLGVFA